MPINELIELCNAMRISIGHFITPSEYTPFLKDRSKYIIPEVAFKPIRMRPNALQNLSPYIKGTERQLSIGKLATMLNMSKATLSFWIKNQESIKTGEIINLCNKLQCDLDVLFDDPNTELLPNMLIEQTSQGALLHEQDGTIYFGKPLLQQKNVTHKQPTNDILTDGKAEYISDKRRHWEANYKLVLSLFKHPEKSGENLLTANEARTGNLTMSRLIELCNKLHISSRHFFVKTDGVIPLYPQDKYPTSDNSWVTIIWHPEYIRELYGSGSVTGLSLAEIAEMEGLSETKMQNWRKSVSNMHMSDFVNLLNKLEITPTCLIEDKNKSNVVYSTTYNDLLIAENRMLRQQLFRLWRKFKGKKD